AVVQHMLEDGSAWMSGSRWRDRAVLRISVSNWSTSADDVARSLAALRRAVGAPSPFSNMAPPPLRDTHGDATA
ncbi:MAG TPA: hypothetical protein VNB23_11830, partial [Ramlibacter sp.]|nr:hypothetical protein [Ramlibacter sp.]